MVIDARTKSRITYTLPVADSDTATIDTLYRVDMGFSGARERNPIPLDEVGDVVNYYQPSGSFTGVVGYKRLVYWSLWDSVDVHYSQGITGPRMAFVVRPGGSPESIVVTFLGQDSLNIDWQGALRLYRKLPAMYIL